MRESCGGGRVTDKQQIEEMAKLLCSDYGECEKCFLYCSEETPCSVDDDCDKLYNANYRKVPENAVVLTQEEYEKYQNLKRDVEYSFEYNQGYTDGQIKGQK